MKLLKMMLLAVFFASACFLMNAQAAPGINPGDVFTAISAAGTDENGNDYTETIWTFYDPETYVPGVTEDVIRIYSEYTLCWGSYPIKHYSETDTLIVDPDGTVWREVTTGYLYNRLGDCTASYEFETAYIDVIGYMMPITTGVITVNMAGGEESHLYVEYDVIYIGNDPVVIRTKFYEYDPVTGEKGELMQYLYVEEEADLNEAVVYYAVAEMVKNDLADQLEISIDDITVTDISCSENSYAYEIQLSTTVDGESVDSYYEVFQGPNNEYIIMQRIIGRKNPEDGFYYLMEFYALNQSDESRRLTPQGYLETWEQTITCDPANGNPLTEDITVTFSHMYGPLNDPEWINGGLTGTIVYDPVNNGVITNTYYNYSANRADGSVEYGEGNSLNDTAAGGLQFFYDHSWVIKDGVKISEYVSQWSERDGVSWETETTSTFDEVTGNRTYTHLWEYYYIDGGHAWDSVYDIYYDPATGRRTRVEGETIERDESGNVVSHIGFSWNYDEDGNMIDVEYHDIDAQAVNELVMTELQDKQSVINKQQEHRGVIGGNILVGEMVPAE